MKSKNIKIVLLFLIALLPLVVKAAQLNSSNYQIYSYVISSGGSNITSSNYKTDLTIGHVADNITSSSYKNFLGFWYTTISAADKTPPGINFTAPTPANNTKQSQTYVEINVSITESSLDAVKFNWNGTNYTIFNDSLVLMFNFDNRSALGEQTVGDNNWTVDISGNANNGSFYGNATINLTDGRYAGGLQLDGNGSYVNCGSAFPSGNMTILAWIRAPSVAGAETHIFGDNMLKLGYSRIRHHNVTTNIVSDDTVSANTWIHAGITINNNILTFYVNGASSGGSSTGRTSFTAGRHLIGGQKTDGSAFFNGTIDEVMIFNRSLSAAEIQQLYFTNLYKYNTTQWYLYVNQSKNSTDGLDNGDYTYQAHAADTSGNWNDTEERTITIGAVPPVWNSNQSNLTTDNRINYDVWFYVNWSDNDGLSHYIFSWNGTNSSWVNDTAVLMTGTVNQSNVTKIINLSQGNTIGWRFYANDTANNFNHTDIWTFTVNNTPPTTLNLSYPLNNTPITNTTPRFNWTNATDADGDKIYYDIFIRCFPICSVDNRDEYNLTTPYYTPTAPLRFYADDNYRYEWYVRAFDNISYGQNSSKFNFSISSSVTISLPTANVSFGAMNLNQQNDTTNDNPPPLVIQNDGNCYINVNITVDRYLWDSNQSPSKYFQFKIDNVSEEKGSFNSSASATPWTFFNSSTNITSINQLNYTDATDSAEIDINLTVPPAEPPGKKNSTILFTGYYVMVT